MVGAFGIHRHDVRAKTLHDLSVVGQGEPVVVQVHDPSCALCRRLKSSTVAALKDAPHIQYRIANLNDAEGRAMSQEYGVGKVTLLLFNARGTHVYTVQGVTPKEELTQIFNRFLRAPAA